MRTTTIVTGVLLFLLGPIFFVLAGSGPNAKTAFIPSIFGIALIVCGALAKTVKSTKMAMHIAVVVALVGALGCKRFMSHWPALLSGGGSLSASEKLSSTSGLLMFLLCGFFVVRSVLWFLGNRAARPIA